MSLEKNTPRQNRVREALERIYDQHPPHFAEYLRRFREDPKSRVFAPLAEAYRRMGRVDDAINICREGLEHHPDFHGGRVALAKCFIDKKLFEDAKAELKRVIQAAPENLLAQRLLGDTYLGLQDSREALHCYKMALLLSPQDVALNEKVYALEKAVRAEEATPDTGGTITNAAFDGTLRFDMPEAGELISSEPESSQVEESTGTGEWQSPPPNSEVFHPSIEFHANEEESNNAADPEVQSKINQILGFDGPDAEDESFRIQHVSAVFEEENEINPKEITTETLGDLYFSQGQFDKSLRIFEKIAKASTRPNEAILKKVEDARKKLGVDERSLIRAKQIRVLQGVLDRLHESY
jgi:tetratricopeptide (TPR) repeat protein